MDQKNISFSCVIVKDQETSSYYGMVKEVEGVVVKGKSEEEVMQKIPMAIKAIINAKRKFADTTERLLKDHTMVVKEYEQNYVAC